jgi:hypothetical protein
MKIAVLLRTKHYYKFAIKFGEGYFDKLYVVMPWASDPVPPVACVTGFYRILRDAKNLKFHDIVYFFDWFPLSTYILNRIVAKSQRVFIQHGLFMESENIKIKRPTSLWYVSYVSYSIISYILLYRDIYLPIKYWKLGAKRALELSEKSCEFDRAYFLNSISLDYTVKSCAYHSNTNTVIGGFDEPRLIYDRNVSTVAYISQPCHLVGDISKTELQHIHRLIYSVLGSNLLIVVHPGFDEDFFKSFPKEILVRYDDLSKMKVKYIIGHYSTLMLSLKVPIYLLSSFEPRLNMKTSKFDSEFEENNITFNPNFFKEVK